MLTQKYLHAPADTLGFTGRYRTRNQSNGTWGNWVNKPASASVHEYGVAYGIDIPHFHARRKRGELLPMSNYWRFDGRINYGRLSGEYTDSTKAYNPTYQFENDAWLNCWCDYDELAALVEDYVDLGSYLVQTAAARIYSSGWDALTFFAELHQARDMLLRFARNVVRSFRSSGLGLATDLRSASNTWLEGRYGWRPLVYDMKDIVKVITSIDDGRKRYRENARATASSTFVRETTSTFTGQGVLHRDYRFVDEIGVVGSVVADIAPPRVAFNPVTSAWELVRFSFIVDWVYDIGTFLEAMSFLALSTAHVSAAGYYIKRVGTLESVTVDPIGTCSINITGNTGVEYVGEYKLRVPTSVITPPHSTLKLDAFKVIDLITLIFQGLSRR